jgi:putative hemolysin
MHQIGTKRLARQAIGFGLVLFAFLAVLSSSGEASAKEITTVTISQQGGFVSPQYQLGKLPQLVGYSSGLVLKRNDASPVFNASQALQVKVDASKMTRYLLSIYKAAKTPMHGWGFPGVADVPTTTIVINTPGFHLNRNVYALDFSNGNLSSEQKAKRLALSAALTKFSNWVNSYHSSVYRPSRYELWALSAEFDNGGVGIANPASMFCRSMNGSTEISHTDSGDVGICVLGDGTRLDEWEYFRNESPKYAKWPKGISVPQSPNFEDGTPAGGCVSLRFEKVAAILASKNAALPLLLDSGQLMPVFFRPVLPGELACHRVG